MDHWIQSKALKWIELNLLVGLQWQSFFSCPGGQNVHVHVQCNYWFTVYMYMYNIVSKFQKHYWCPHSFTPLFHFWTCHLIMRQHRLKSHSMMHAKCNSLGSPAQEEWEERRGAGAGSMIYGGRNDLTHPGRRGRERERERAQLILPLSQRQSTNEIAQITSTLVDAAPSQAEVKRSLNASLFSLALFSFFGGRHGRNKTAMKWAGAFSPLQNCLLLL